MTKSAPGPTCGPALPGDDPSAAARPAPTGRLRLAGHAAAAGGWAAIGSTARVLHRETGLLRGAGALLRVNQDQGFDCPGCAWPEPAKRSRFEFCENGAKAVADEATRRRATPEVFAAHSVEQLRQLSDFELGQLGRITHPMVVRGQSRQYEPIEWDQAFALIAQHLRELPSPDAASFYTSGRTSNEAAFLYQLFVRRFGTNNLPDCSNMCHESSGVGLTEALGVGKGTVGLDDFECADAIFVIGQNPGTNHPRMLSALREAAARGCRIVSINPLREAGLIRFAHPQKVGDLLSGGRYLSHEYLQLRIGSDVAVLTGMCKRVLEQEAQRPGQVIDQDFIAAHCTGFDDFRAAVEQVCWDRISSDSGLPREQIERAADIYIAAERTIVCWCMGITQHANGVANVQAIVNLLLLKGNLGRPGAGACPVRGHSNVQGDRTMGITEKPGGAFLARLRARFGFSPPAHHGLDTVGTIAAMRDGQVRVFVALGGNFHSATPDTATTERALQACALTVHVSTKANRAHLYPGRVGLILPCLGRTEIDEQRGARQFVTVEDSMSMVHRSQGQMTPASPHLRSEPAIIAGMAAAVLGSGRDCGIDWELLAADYDLIRDHIAAVIVGFSDFNRRVRVDPSFRLPNSARHLDFSAIGGRARFICHPLPDLTLPPGRFRMTTIRSHDQYNTTVYGLDDRYRGVYRERRVVLVNAEDLAELGVGTGQPVDLTSEYRGVERSAPGFLAVPYDLPRGCVATYFPEANVLVPLESTAAGSNTPTSKSVVVRIAPGKL
jgi:molybdopterin-dependent oxidoreductase alpha subunit